MSDPKAPATEKNATAGPSTEKTAGVEEKKKLPQLGALEDDDEFEVSGIPIYSGPTSRRGSVSL